MPYEETTDDERADLPAAEFMETGDDPKGWDRASITMKTHPLHAFPSVSQADFILPSAANKFRLVADCLAIGAAFALLVYFPLMMIGFMSTSDQTRLVLGTMLTAGFGSALLVFLVAVADERAFHAELEP
jgi:hypothetical protein